MFNRGHFPSNFSGLAARLAEFQGGRSFSPSSAQRDDIGLPATRQRILVTVVVLSALMILLGSRLLWLQGLGQVPLRIEATKTQITPPRRADILARDGTALAVTLDEYTVSANPCGVRPEWRKRKLAHLLAQNIGGDQEKYFALLQNENNPKAKDGRNHYVRLARRVPSEKIEALKKLRITKGIKQKSARRERREFWAQVAWSATPRRHYPLKSAACQLIGYTTADEIFHGPKKQNPAAKPLKLAKSALTAAVGPTAKPRPTAVPTKGLPGLETGVIGLESAWNDVLAGRPETVKTKVDTAGRPVPQFVNWDKSQAAIPARSVVTTLDWQIQESCDEALAAMLAKYHPKQAVAIVLDPKTGEVLAMSNAPTFDLNDAASATNKDGKWDRTLNACLRYAYEPGSTFKLITASAAVETVPHFQTYSFVCNGSQQVGKHNMHCWISSTSKHMHGRETLENSIRDSCNFGVYGFARLVGRETMLKYAEKYSLGQNIDVGRLRDNRGQLPGKPSQWGDAQFANFAFGQGMTITPMQLARVAATIANDGVMMKPLLVKELRNEAGDVVERFKPAVDHRVIKSETAREVKRMMVRVISEGTARKFVFIPGYGAGGKTGSAQKSDGPRGYSSSRFISSLVGFVPAEKPRFVVMVMADEPHGSHWGSEVCGPAFESISIESMRQLRLRDGASAPAPKAELMVRNTEVKKAH